MNKEKFKQTGKKVLPALLLCGVVGMGALAWLVDNDVTQEQNKFQAGLLSVIFENEANVINDLNAIPTSRDTALAGTPYTFTVKNDGTIDEMVRLAATGVSVGASGQMLSEDLINVVIVTEDGETVYDGKLTALNEGIAVAGTGEVQAIAASEGVNMKLYAWVDQTATKEDVYVLGTEDEIKTPNSIQFGLKAFAIQEADAFADEAEGTSYEDQWDALAGNINFGA